MRKRFLSLFLIFCLLLSGCGSTGAGPASSSDSFQDFTSELFRSTVTSDSLTLNYTLSSPENYGIDSLPDGFPSFSGTDLSQSMSATENTLSRLQSYDKDELTFEDQVLYDTLADSLENDLQEEKMIPYASCFDPSSGIQAQLPVLLSEFLIDDPTDIEQYFSLIRSLPDYFNSLLAFEQAKTATKTLPAKSTIQKTITQCQQLLTSGTGPLQRSFENRLADLSFLSADERSELSEKHKLSMKNELLPAYRSLVQGLTDLLAHAPADGALASYSGGQNYYACLIRQKTGSQLTPEQLNEELTRMLTTAEQDLFSIAAKTPSAFTSCETYTARYTDPAQILQILRQKMSADFPGITQQTCYIRYVDPSLEEFLSPAFYLTPPIDEKTANVIYINGADKYKHSGLFNTLAHEAYPGHLYQNCYMRQKKMNPLRYVLNFPGYTEGYATYAELYSYRYLGATQEEMSILQNNAVSILCIYALCDLGIHYFHWNHTQLTTFLQSHGVYADESIQSIYDNIIDSPGSYLPYTVGYLEITKLKALFQKQTGKSDSDLLFHQYLLDMGPAPFSVLKQYFLSWIERKGLQ